MSMKYSGRVNLQEILNGPQFEAAVRRETERIANRARANAPVKTGHLRDSIVTSVRKNSGTKNDRVVGTVTATAPHSASTEFGSSRSRAHFYLRRAVQS